MGGMGGFYSWTEMSMGVGGGNTNENRKGGGGSIGKEDKRILHREEQWRIGDKSGIK